MSTGKAYPRTPVRVQAWVLISLSSRFFNFTTFRKGSGGCFGNPQGVVDPALLRAPGPADPADIATGWVPCQGYGKTSGSWLVAVV